MERYLARVAFLAPPESLAHNSRKKRPKDTSDKEIPVNELKNVFVKSCSGEQERISGHVSLRFSFEGDNGNKVSFIHDVLITDFVQHPLLLGRDFTGSSAKLLETNSHLFLSDSDKNFENLNEMLTSPKAVSYTHLTLPTIYSV